MIFIRRRSCAPSFAQSRSWSGLLFDRDTRVEKIAERKRCRARALCKDAGQNSAAFPERYWRVARRRHGFDREDLVQTLFPCSKPSKLKCGYGLSNWSKGRSAAVKSSPVADSSWRARSIIPKLERQLSRRPLTTRQFQLAAMRSIDSSQRERAIPGGQLARNFRPRVFRECNVRARRR